jgi:2-polyprenyl-6-methoxyphenol hydroxylase-like FAD-dependent oxidoreductase
MSSKAKSGGFSNRVSFITPSSAKLFKEIGIWDEIKDRHAWPVHDLRVISFIHLGYRLYAVLSCVLYVDI